MTNVDLFKLSKDLLSFQRGVPEAWVATGTHELEVVGELAQVESDKRLVQLHPQLPLLAAQEHLVGQVERRVDPAERPPGTMRPTVFLVFFFFWPTTTLHKARPPEVMGHGKSVSVKKGER